MSYVDSELAVQEAVDRVCNAGRFQHFNSTSVNGVTLFVELPHHTGNEEDRKELVSTCQNLVADFEDDIVLFFYSKKGTSEIQAAERAVCTDIARMCRIQDIDRLQANVAQASKDQESAPSHPSDAELLKAAKLLQSGSDL